MWEKTAPSSSLKAGPRLSARVKSERGCHPEQGQRPGEGPNETHEVAWSPAGLSRCVQRNGSKSSAGTTLSDVRSRTRLRRVRDDITFARRPLSCGRKSETPPAALRKSNPHYYFFAGASPFGAGAGAAGRELCFGCAAGAGAGLCCCQVLNFCASLWLCSGLS